jgi:hypothetical protein
MISKILSAALVSAAIAAAPAIGSAATIQPNPIQIENVQATSSDRSVDGPTLTITYANQSPVPVSDVLFVNLSNGQIVDGYEDSGNFTTGATINHTFFNDAPAADTQLAVDVVKFADGSTWVNPALATDAVTPTSISYISPEHDS